MFTEAWPVPVWVTSTVRPSRPNTGPDVAATTLAVKAMTALATVPVRSQPHGFPPPPSGASAMGSPFCGMGAVCLQAEFFAVVAALRLPAVGAKTSQNGTITPIGRGRRELGAAGSLLIRSASVVWCWSW